MWNLANRGLRHGHGKAHGLIVRCTSRIESIRDLSKTTKTSEAEAPYLNSKSKSLNLNTSTGAVKKLFENTSRFLKQHENSAWTSAEVEQANSFLRDWSHHTIPKNQQISWVIMVDQLMTSILQSSEESNQQKMLIPDSDTFCSIITMYSKSKLPDAAERAHYWLQKMIHLSDLYPDCVTSPRATLFTNVLAAWEKSRSLDAERRSATLWNQLRSTKGLTPTSGAYYLYISLWSKSDKPEIAERILRKMVQEGKRNRKIIPSCAMFVNVISSWRRIGQAYSEGSGRSNQIIVAEAPDRAQAVLDLLIMEYVRRSKLKPEWLKIEINDIPFNATIQTIGKSKEIPLQQAEKRINFIFKRMKGLGVQPTMVTAWSALNLYETSVDGTTTEADALNDVPGKIMRLLDLSMSHCGGGKNPMLQNQIYSKAMKIVSKSGDCRAADIGEGIFLNRYMKLPRKDRRIETTIDGFENSIKAWVNDKSHSAEERERKIFRLLEKMESEVHHIHHIYKRKYKHDPSITCRLFASLAKAAVISKLPFHAQQRSEDNMKLLLAECRKQKNFTPSATWFEDIIKAAEENFTESDANDLTVKVYREILDNEPLFYRMLKKLNAETNDELCAETFLTRALNVLVTTGSKDAGRLGEIILLKLQELHEEGTCSSPPTFDKFKKVLYCWSSAEDKSAAAERMENMLQLAQSLFEDGDDFLRPDFDGYMTVINAWSESRLLDAPDRIQTHLKSLQERRLEGDLSFKIDSCIYIALIRAFSNSGREDSKVMAISIFESCPEHLRNTTLYNVLIEAQDGDSRSAEELLQFMEKHKEAKPNTETYNAVMQVWLRSGSPMSAWRVDALFNRMQDLTSSGKLDVKPNSRTFDLVISTLAQEWGTELAKVDKYIDLLKKHYQAGDCLPTTKSYNEAIRAWACNVDDPRAILRAQALLDEMHTLAREGVDTIRPNRRTYEMYLGGLQQSTIEDRSQFVNDVLFKMKQNDIDLDSQLQAYIQRCLLPLSSRVNSWIVNVDEQSDVVEVDQKIKQMTLP